ncbi:MAG TPA: glycosyltransferase family 2 protein [Bacteroidota bacterium]
MISIIIVQYNKPELTKQCIKSVSKHCGVPHEIILVDNNSEDPEARSLGATLPGIRFLQNTANEGFGKANNKAAAVARGDIFFFLNNDTIVENDLFIPIRELIDNDRRIGIVGPRLLNQDHSLQLSAGSLPSILTETKDRLFYRRFEARAQAAVEHAHQLFSVTREVEWVTGAALFIRRNLFESLGGFDEEFFMFFEDKDLCLRARLLGAKVVYSAGTSLVHLRGASASSATNGLYRASQLRYYGKHRSQFEQVLLKVYLRIRKWEYGE